VDVARTVGWFTAVFPVRVPVAAGRQPRATLALIGEHLRRIPEGGIGWGLLALGGGSRSRAYREGPRPQISCNYLGRIDPPLGREWWPAPESAGREIGRRGTRPTALDVVGHLAADRLHVALHYDGARRRRVDVAAFADRMLAVLRELAHPDAARRTS
jgi:non-ribosomal peptide synthase protein (TIGR01720 family)